MASPAIHIPLFSSKTDSTTLIFPVVNVPVLSKMTWGYGARVLESSRRLEEERNRLPLRCVPRVEDYEGNT